MSKSLGNVISPEDVIYGAPLSQLEEGLKEAHRKGLLSNNELKTSLSGQKKLFPTGIPECGVDALRFTLCSQAIQGLLCSVLTLLASDSRSSSNMIDLRLTLHYTTLH